MPGELAGEYDQRAEAVGAGVLQGGIQCYCWELLSGGGLGCIYVLFLSGLMLSNIEVDNTRNRQSSKKSEISWVVWRELSVTGGRVSSVLVCRPMYFLPEYDVSFRQQTFVAVLGQMGTDTKSPERDMYILH